MQKIFIINSDSDEWDDAGNFSTVNDFIKDSGNIISVTAQHVAHGNSVAKGKWLVVAEDGKNNNNNKNTNIGL